MKEAGNQYNLIILLMPTQAIIICFLVYFYSISGSEIEVSPLGMSAILTSLSLVFLSIFIVKSLQRAIAYKEDYKLAEERLDSQLNEYRKLYFEQEEARKERHDMSNNLIALTGTLEDGRIQEAIDRMKSINATINKPDILMKTGIPEIDAVINAKLSRANKHDINLISKVKVGHALKINAYDFSRIIANALDNAIEGIERSSDVKREIYLNINCTANFVSLIVENYASGLVNANFQTSKPDKINHGFGMTQMKTITEKYDGDFQPEYDHKSGKFLLKILLKNRKI
jgi:sensor histidine kinase regulating citrate/malate metabolism